MPCLCHHGFLGHKCRAEVSPQMRTIWLLYTELRGRSRAHALVSYARWGHDSSAANFTGVWQNPKETTG